MFGRQPTCYVLQASVAEDRVLGKLHFSAVVGVVFRIALSSVAKRYCCECAQREVRVRHCKSSTQ